MKSAICAGLFGSPDFRRRLAAPLVQSKCAHQVVEASLAEAWSAILEHKPQLAIFEVGFRSQDDGRLRSLLEKLRERFDRSIFTAAALLDPRKLSFGGDLLFQSGGIEPSELLDTFLAAPPSGWPGVPDLARQAVDILEIAEHEMRRRDTGGKPLPALNSEGWAQSMADPASRQLWIKWLPRYAGYISENPLVIGETGTGKSNLAYALHLYSGREGQFVGMTPRDFSSSELVQTELFGALPGAYTGAVDKWGLVKSAEKGTLFVDELQSIDKDLQGKLITFIENKIYRRVGSSERVEADVRFVFAANRTLGDMISAQILRHDFAYRLERVQLALLPLRQRRLDVTAALAYSLTKVQRLRPGGRQVHGFTPEAYRILFGSHWPGNLRQLENCVAKLYELADMQNADLIGQEAVAELLDARFLGPALSGPEVFSSAALRLADCALSEQISGLEMATDKFREISRHCALDAAGGDAARAAELIGDSRAALELLSPPKEDKP